MKTYTIPHSAAKALLRGSTVELAPGVFVRALPEIVELEEERERQIPILTADLAVRLGLRPDDTIRIEVARSPDPRLRLLGNPTPLCYGEAEVSIGHGTLTIRVPLGHPIHLAVEERGLGADRLFRLHPPGWPEVIVFAVRLDRTLDVLPVRRIGPATTADPPPGYAEISFVEYPDAYDPVGCLAERLAAGPPTVLSLVR